jgi:putative Holliday junction resolvase
VIVADLESLRAALPRHHRLLGLDVGEKTIGLALSDPGLSVASPISTIKRTKFTADANALLKLAAELLKLKDLPILFWDERLSTMAVEREMIAHDVTRARRDKIVDQAAAAFILQGVLDAMGRTKASSD